MMSKKIRILTMGLSDNLGGIETCLFEIATHIDTEKYQLDFLAYQGEKPCYKKELEANGSNFFYITERRKNYIVYLKELRKLLKTERFDILHCNLNSLSNFEPIFLALRFGIKVVVQSHNADFIGTLKSELLHRLGYVLLPRKKVTCVAVSDLAGKWMFRNKIPYIVLNNGVNVSKYEYDEVGRRRIRNEFNLDNEEIILHVGRFSKQKNHDKLIDIFKDYLNEKPNTILMLVGEGELKDHIKDRVNKLGINGSVIFTGKRNDIPKILSAADKFLLPSFYEGFPNVLIEAEASGLYCVVSDTITKEAMFSGLCKSVSLDSQTQKWVEVLNKKPDYNRKLCGSLVRKAGLSIETEITKLTKIYEECMKNK